MLKVRRDSFTKTPYVSKRERKNAAQDCKVRIKQLLKQEEQ